MTAAITGGISMASGLIGMIGGLRSAKQVQVSPPLEFGPGIAPEMFQLAGQEQQAAYKSQADSLSQEAALVFEQSQQDAAQKLREVTAFREQQSLRFSSSGITLAGSPLGVLEETRALGQQEADAITRRGQAASALYEQEGLRMLRQGSAAAFSGFANALQSNYSSRLQSIQNQYDYHIRQQQAAMQQSQMRTQAYRTGLSGLEAGIQGFASLFKSGGGSRGGGYGGGGVSDPWSAPIALTPNGTI